MLRKLLTRQWPRLRRGADAKRNGYTLRITLWVLWTLMVATVAYMSWHADLVANQPSNPLATYTDAMIVSQLGVDVWRAIRTARAAMDRFDLSGQPQILSRSSTHRPIAPGVKSAPRDLQHAAHHSHRMGGLVGLQESEERFEVGFSVANQAAAFDRISRSSCSLRFSRRSLASSSRSALVRSPPPLPASRASCLTHKEIDQGVGPNSFANDAGVRLSAPARPSVA